MTKLEWKEICCKTKFASQKKRLTKKELGELMDGYLAIKNLGVYKQPEFTGNRKLLDKHW